VSDLPQIVPLGDSALLVTFAQSISWGTGVKVRAAADRIRRLQIAHVTDVVPAYTALGIYFDGTKCTRESIASSIAATLQIEDVEDASVPPIIEIPVRYDGPDLDEVAERTGLSVADVIARHCSRTYRAYMSGFAPGFTYLGDLDEALVLPRRSVPRTRVARGSVAIAGAQTAVYPLETPGGWHLIGTTNMVMFDASREPPALLRAGDTVQFVRID
jgi:inhibitor of KinA